MGECLQGLGRRGLSGRNQDPEKEGTLVLKFLHAADFHLDSAFAGLRPEQAAARRRESRESCRRFADYAARSGAQLVLLSGDLFDSARAFRETGEILRAALAEIPAPVLIAPGNHDWYGPDSPYAECDWPENVHIFKTGRPEAVKLPGQNVTVWGAAFTGPEQPQSLLRDVHAPQDGRVHVMVLHGEAAVAAGCYNPLSREEIETAGFAYLALGHIHKPGQMRCGGTLCAWPGCLEGHGFDEQGDRGFYEGTIGEGGAVEIRWVPFARRRYEALEVDVTDTAPEQTLRAALPEGTGEDLYRITLTGETDARGIDLAALQEQFAPCFYALELRDETRVRPDVWARAQEDSLRGLFLRELRQELEQAQTPEERDEIQRAVRMGLAALDHRDRI